MNLILKIVCIIIGTSFLWGCATATTAISKEQLQALNCGAYPDNYKELIKQCFPDTAKYTFSTPTKGYSREAPITGGDPTIYGYIVYTTINQKGDFGAYVGAKEFRFLIRDQVVYTIRPNLTFFSEPWFR